MRHIRMAIAAAAGLAALEAASPDDSSLSESARIDRTMVYIREHNQDLGFEGPGEVDPAATAKQGGPAGRYPAAPYLLVGVRDSKGYRSYVSPVSGTRTSAAVNVASSTKSFTAALILQLDQEGKLSIDDTLADPRWKDVVRWPNGENITLRMMLAHTAGIPDYENSEAFAGRKLDPYWDPTPEEVIALVRRLRHCSSQMQAGTTRTPVIKFSVW